MAQVNQLRVVLKLAALSRIVVLVLQMIFNLLPDHRADAFNPSSKENGGILDEVLKVTLDGYHKWDAKYFLFIAENGYTKEQMYAFFPLFPMTMRSLALVMQKMPMALTIQSRLLLSGALLNFSFFIGAVRALYYLTLKTYGNEKFAILTALTFSFNPASIFFSANYTESLYAFCVFQALYFLKDGSLMKSTLFFVCASATRSNGLLNFGFPAYFMIENLLNLYRHEKKMLPHLVLFILKSLAIALIIMMPFCAFNMMAYTQFCAHPAQLTGGIRSWCSSYPPLIYQHVQSKHWGLGFLNYYKFRKIPNILLAIPCITLIFRGILCYLCMIRENMPLGLPSLSSRSHVCKLQFASKDIFVYLVHVAVLILFGIFFMHVEVVTRFVFSSSPFPNWVSASILLRDMGDFKVPPTFTTLMTSWSKSQLSSKLLFVYYASYFVIGTLLHVNFLPWT